MIKIEHLHKSFNQLEVLKDINIEVQDGETIAIIGPSGSGKSTLLRCINLLETPQRGKVTVGNLVYDAKTLDKKEYLAFRRETAMVFQSYGLFANKTVLGNIITPLMVVKRWTKEKAIIHAEELLKQVGLVDKKDVKPQQLSGGQQQRVAIARALALQPQVILFDEPTSALDPELVQEVLEVMKQITKKKMTSIIVTHEIKFAREVANRVIFMDHGRIVEQGEASQVIDAPKQERTKRFLANYRS